MALTAGGNEIKVWDILCGGKLLHTFSSHLKNITGMTFDGTGSRLLSCGLDGHVKVTMSYHMLLSNGTCMYCVLGARHHCVSGRFIIL